MRPWGNWGLGAGRIFLTDFRVVDGDVFISFGMAEHAICEVINKINVGHINRVQPRFLGLSIRTLVLNYIAD